MIAIAIFPLVFCVVGALMYAFAGNGKAQQLGFAMFCCGFFWMTYVLTDKTFRL